MVHTVRSEATQPAASSACARAPRIRSWIGGLALLLSVAALLFFSGQKSAAQVVDRALSNIGVIAYATAAHEIWVVNADGSNARKLWEVPEHRRADMTGMILDLRWSKDGSKLAFTSPHEPLCSLHERNIYVINADGSGFRRVTNRPTCDEVAHLPTGTVQISLGKQSSDIQIVQVLVEGALAPVTVTLLTQSPRTVTIPNVPDLGPGVEQVVVVVEGNNRWFHLPGVDVLPGETVHAGTLTIGPNNVVRNGFGAWNPSWSPDSASLGFLVGPGLPQRVSLDGGLLQRSDRLFSEGIEPAFAIELAWSPVDDTIIYTAFTPEIGFAVYRATAGSAGPAQRVVQTDETRGLAWTPDGTGFVVANYFVEFMTPRYSNLFHIDLATGEPTRLTDYDNHFAYAPSVSPDGQQVIFHYMADFEPDTPSILRIVPITGGAESDFGPANAFQPAWGPGSVSTAPTATPTTAPPTATPTSTPGDPTATPTDVPPVPTATPGPGGAAHTLHLPVVVR
ncbi:MAG: PD40 domain-containing protein [Caldilineaceae bacterium]|nr:PD40 domain-containing protein [Caldilineaceae bacterium]